MKLDILLPLYAPKGDWANTIADAIHHLQSELGNSVEITLFITNDGASEEYYPAKSLQKISDCVNGRFHFVKYFPNRGKGYSIRNMAKLSTGDFIIYTDGDFPFGWRSVADTFKLLAAGYDVVMGRRNRSYDTVLTPFRKCLSGGVKALNSILCGLPPEIRDTQAGLKGFSRRGLEIFLMTTVNTFVFDTEFILLAWNNKLKIAPLDVQLAPGLKLSSMGLKVLFRELYCFAKVLWRIRVMRKFKKKLLPRFLLSFDIEEFDLPEEYGASISTEEKFEISQKGTESVLSLLKERGVRATFFVTGLFAARYPELIRQMAADGHEVASHGMDHSSFEKSHLKESLEILEKISGKKITGFRMARLAKVEKQDITEAGFSYESSLNPVWLPGRYCNLSSPLLPFKEECGLRQFPISALPLVRFPLFWLSFKNLPLSIYKLLTRIAIGKTGYFNMYSHPWEYNQEIAASQWCIPGFIARHAGAEQRERLNELILYLSQYGEFVTFSEFLEGSVPDKGR